MNSFESIKNLEVYGSSAYEFPTDIMYDFKGVTLEAEKIIRVSQRGDRSVYRLLQTTNSSTTNTTTSTTSNVDLYLGIRSLSGNLTVKIVGSLGVIT